MAKSSIRCREIVLNSSSRKKAMDELIEDGLCVSKSQAKRVYMQIMSLVKEKTA